MRKSGRLLQDPIDHTYAHTILPLILTWAQDVEITPND